MTRPDPQAPRLDELGEAGLRAHRYMVLGIRFASLRNGGDPDVTDLEPIMRWLRANRRSASAPPSASMGGGDRMTARQAADRLALTPVHVRRLAASGRHFPGARKTGRDWLIPADEVEQLRRTRDHAGRPGG